MSVDVDWHLLDRSLSQKLVESLNGLLERVSLPSYLGPITVHDFVFGDAPPVVQLVDITDIIESFAHPDLSENEQQEEEEEGHQEDSRDLDGGHEHGDNVATGAAPNDSSSSSEPLDLQLHLRTQYSGNLRIELTTSLLVNYPSPFFMSLPLRLTLTALDFAATWVVGYQSGKRCIHLSMMPSPEDNIRPPSDPDATQPIPASPPPSFAAKPNAANDILKNLQCDPSEVGEADKHVLRNVGKVEKFVLELVRGLLQNELVWPNFVTVHY